MRARFSLRSAVGCFGLPVVVLFSCLVGPTVSHGQTVTWGSAGAGGGGTWDTSATNWFDGTQDVAWPAGGNAIFAGVSGTVNVPSSGLSPKASSITFNTPGYIIQSGVITSGSSGLTITTNADATISSTLSTGAGSTGNMLIKNGAGVLTVAGTNFLDALQVNQGEYRATSSSTLFFSDVTLADAAGVAVTLDNSSYTQMKSLSGGGTQGGIVQPGAQAQTVALSIYQGGNFGGILQDNGSGKLALTLVAGSSYSIYGPGGSNELIYGSLANPKTQTLTNANTYSGATTVDAGILSLSGNGSILNSAVTVSSLGTLVLDNSGTASANRISDSSVFAMRNARLQLIGNTTGAVEEMIGSLSVSGASSITVTQPGSATTQLTFAGFARTGTATLNINGEGVKLPGVTNDSTGIVTPAITAGNDWAKVGGDGRITAFTGYVTNLNTAAATDHVKLAVAGGTTTLAAAGTRASLNLQNSSASNGQVLDLGGQSLALSSGGILSSGTGAGTIQHGSMTTSAANWVVTNNNDLTVSAPILEGGSATGLTKTGSGMLTLSGNNTYAGVTAIEQGTLAVSADSNLGTGSTLDFGGGTLLALGNFSSSKGLTRSTPLGGTINTAGFDVTFSGANSGAVSKVGAGTLTLSNAQTGTTFATAGILALPNATSGDVTLQGGTLRVTGALTSITVGGNSTLDIGGAAPVTLALGSFDANSSGKLTIDFGIGGAGSDLISLSGFFSTSSFSSSAILFDFQNLGNLSPGVDYTLITTRTAIASSASAFALAPDMVAAGWSATFTTTQTSVSVNFGSIPEPDATALLALMGAGLISFRRRASQRPG